MASAREIARETGVSVATVSRALNSQPGVSNQTRQRVMKAANMVGYKGSSSRRTATGVGFALLGDMKMWDYDLMLLDGMRVGLNESKLDAQIVNIPRDKSDDETYTDFFVRRGLRGVVLRTSSEYKHTCEEIASEGFPSIVLAERFESPSISFVSCDSTSASQRGVEHLIQLGHQRIAMVTNRREDRDHADRLQGYRQALETNGIAYDEELIIRIVSSLEGGMNALNELMSRRNPPTAIFFADPHSSVGAMCRANEVGLKLPQQLSILGFDDGNLRNMVCPVMSAVFQDTREIGFEAARWLGSTILGQAQAPLQRVISASLMINQTTGSPPSEPAQLQPSGRPVGG